MMKGPVVLCLVMIARGRGLPLLLPQMSGGRVDLQAKRVGKVLLGSHGSTLPSTVIFPWCLVNGQRDAGTASN